MDSEFSRDPTSDRAQIGEVSARQSSSPNSFAMKKALLLTILSFLTATGVVAREQTPEEIDKMFGGYFTDPDWAKKHGFDNNLPNPTGEQIDMVKRMGEIRQEYWEAYKEGGPKFEDVKVRFALVLFYRDAFQMLTDTNSGVPDIFRSKKDIVQGWPYELLGNLMRLSTASGEPIPKSALGYFSFWSRQFHGDLNAKSLGGIPNYPAIPGIWKDAFPRYQAYRVARDWAELCRAPFPLPIELFVFGLVQRWPMPASYEQAMKDYQTLLTTFGKERVFAVGKRVQAAMDQEGDVNPAALGIVIEESIANGISDSPYEMLWILLTKDDPKLARLHQVFKDRQKRAFFGDPFATRKDDLPLQPLVDEFNRTGGATPTPAPKPTILAAVPTPTPTLEPTPTPEPTPSRKADSIYKALIPRTAEEIEKINALRHEYADEWNKLDATQRNWKRDEDVTLEIQTIRSTGAEEIALLRNRIISLKTCAKPPLRSSLPTPTPTPAISILIQDYNKKWESTYAECIHADNRSDILDQELAFRASLEGLDQSNQLQKLTRWMEYFGELHGMIFRAGKKLEEWEPHLASGLKEVDLSAKPTLAAPTPTPTPTPASTPTPTLTPTPLSSEIIAQRKLQIERDKEAEIQTLIQQFDRLWTQLPEVQRNYLQKKRDETEALLKSDDQDAKVRALKMWISYLKTILPIPEP
jgi:hypothetical protein